MTPSPTPSAPPASLAHQATVQWVAGAVLVLAPLFRSGKPPLAVLAMELLAVALLLLVLWQPRKHLASGWEALALALLFALPLLYLVPLPAGWAAWLPGRLPYGEAQTLAADGSPQTFTRLSLLPLETESALLLLLVPVALFLGTRFLEPRRILTLVGLLLGVGAVQSLLGLLQYTASEGSPALLGLTIPDVARALGTYTNPDHLAGLLEMLLPLALALMFYSIGRHDGPSRRGWREQVSFFGSLRGHEALVYGALALLILIGLIFTRSRAGIALGMLGILLSTLMFARRIGGYNVYGPTGTLIAFTLGSGIAIGLVPVLDRFSVEESVQDARLTIYTATLGGIGRFSPVGSGPGTYPEVFPAFQPPELGRWFVNHAHNDYLEWLFEGGLLAAVLITLLAVLYALRWLKVWTPGAWSRLRFIQVGAGIGLGLLLLHSLVDFNLHIPANIAYFGFLAGVFFAEQEDESEPARHRVRGTPRLAEGGDEPPPLPARRRPATPAPNQIPNPFLDGD